MELWNYLPQAVHQPLSPLASWKPERTILFQRVFGVFISVVYFILHIVSCRFDGRRPVFGFSLLLVHGGKVLDLIECDVSSSEQ